ncbi:MAG: hypothetical protein JMDDDDMK_02109 [Acidobacteria bacterium]|nr:hypothetical protein [Acidobacteriota bacterium]
MKWNEANFSMTDIAVVGLLRFVSGFGLGLLLAESIGKQNQKRVGWSLLLGSVAVGAPLSIKMLRKRERDFIPAQHNGHEQPINDQVVF